MYINSKCYFRQFIWAINYYCEIEDNAINANSLKVIKKNVLKYEDINFHLTRQYISTSIYLIYKTSMRLPDKGKGHSV